MIARIAASIVALLVIGTGVAYAATQLASSDGTQVCVNSVNGLMRVATQCRDGEYPMSIGGGSNVLVSQKGTFTVPLGETDVGTTLPLTEVTVSGVCEKYPPTEVGSATHALARVRVDAASGETMDVFSSAGTIGGTTVLMHPVSSSSSSATFGWGEAIVTSNGATATITFGGSPSFDAGGCRYLWQAVETPN